MVIRYQTSFIYALQFKAWIFR